MPRTNATGRTHRHATMNDQLHTTLETTLPPIRPEATLPICGNRSDPTLTFRWLSTDAVLARYPFTRQMLKRMMDRGEFPQSFRIGERKVAWRSDELDAWDASRQRSDVLVYVPRANAAEHLAKRGKGRGRPRTMAA
jgi:predicted DNA-binding transcriptional regulator AlpA